jgi:hypothetical protein
VVVELSPTVAGIEHVNPDDGDVDAVSATVPGNPFRPATVTVEVPLAPAEIVTVVGLAEIVKSWTV